LKAQGRGLPRVACVAFSSDFRKVLSES
jgi:hypothetical protein